MTLYEQRLLNVATALRQSPNPDKFTMDSVGGWCGTPLCALGHYAARADIQSFFRLTRIAGNLARKGGGRIGYDSQAVRDHFGLTYSETADLFGPSGCGGAQTANEAADFIDAFCKVKFAAVETP